MEKWLKLYAGNWQDVLLDLNLQGWKYLFIYLFILRQIDSNEKS